MAHADWIVDVGPGAGHDGGRIVFEGTPADLVAGRSTLTGEHLAAYVGALALVPRERWDEPVLTVEPEDAAGCRQARYTSRR